MKKIVIYGTGGISIFLTQHLKGENAKIIAYIDDLQWGGGQLMMFPLSKLMS